MRGRAAVASYTRLFLLSLQDWTELWQEEIPAQGVFNSCRATQAPVFGFTAGVPMFGNVVEVYDAATGERLMRRRSTALRGWSSLAISPTGRVIAATEGGNVIVLIRR